MVMQVHRTCGRVDELINRETKRKERNEK